MPNTAPTIDNLNGDAVQYVENGPVALLDLGSNAIVSDIDSANFDGGTLTVTYNRQAGDVLSFGGTANAGPGSTVVVGVITVGTYTPITGGGLQFTFNSNATPAAVQEVFRSLTYQTGVDAPPEGTRTFSYTLVDGDGTAGGGSDTRVLTSTVDVVAVNDAPSGSDQAKSGQEDAVFALDSNFGFADPEGSGYAGVYITTLPSRGTLSLNGVSVSVGQFIPAGSSGNLKFQAAPNEFGDPGNNFVYTTFTFQVRDLGGTANGGIDTDQTPNTFTLRVFPVIDPPEVANFGRHLNDPAFYREGGAPTFVDVDLDAVVTDQDSAHFNGGLLRLSPQQGGIIRAGENFDISPGSGITVTSQGVGGQVQYNGATFGTITIDQSSYFEIAFNSDATPAVVSELIRRITFSSSNPVDETRTLQLLIKDGGGGESVVPFYIAITAVNQAPVLTGLEPSVAYSVATAQSGPQILDPDVSFSDEEGNFNGGAFALSGGLAADTLTIKPSGLINTSGSNVTYNGVAIGTFNGGSGGTPLTVSFNAAASTSGIDALIQSLAFQTAGGDSTRELVLRVTDAAGASASDTIIVQVGAGSQPTPGDDYLIGTDGNDYIDALAGNDTLKGLGGDDVLIGGPGADTMDGGAGSDTYYVDNAGDVVIDPVAEGVDRVMTSVSYNLPGAADIEVFEVINPTSTAALILGGNNFGQTIVGNAGNNVINGGGGDDILRGLAGDDTLIGSPGNDTMYGGTGDDVYFVDAIGDQVFEFAGEGTDRVATSVSYALAADAEVETLETDSASRTAAINLTGSNSANTIFGNAGVNTLLGEGGDDTLHGFAGNDYLVGGAGLDNLYGGAGDDRFYIGSADGDRIWEFAGEGYDTVATEVDYELPDVSAVERLEAGTLTATSSLYLGGSNLDNLIIGNAGDNRLRGFGGNDTLHGLDGDDYLIGDEGADVMYGGRGNDTYYVNTSDDRIFENEGEGTNDRVATEVSFTLPDEAEVEVLEAVNLSGTSVGELGGSRYANTITGDAGNNVLRGYGGNDTLTGHLGDDVLIGDEGNDRMIGGAGNDTYYVDAAGDVVVEAAGEGNDRVSTSVSYALAAGAEVETLEASSLGSTAALDLAGSNTANRIIGNSGANVIDGKGGSDVLIGGAGADTFVFSTALGSGNIDRLEDFQSGTDKIGLDRSIFSAVQDGALAAGAFVKGTAATSADHRIIYNETTGALLYDADGSGAGAAIQFASLQPGANLTGSDFTLTGASSTATSTASYSQRATTSWHSSEMMSWSDGGDLSGFHDAGYAHADHLMQQQHNWFSYLPDNGDMLM